MYEVSVNGSRKSVDKCEIILILDYIQGMTCVTISIN